MAIATKPVQPIATARPAGVGPLYRFTVKQYERMTELGILTPDDRVELLEGWVVQKMPQYPPHAVAVELARDCLRAALPAGWHSREQKPLSLPDSQPEPDLAVVSGSVRDYARRHPRLREVALIIEVADTTVATDRDYKGPLYANVRIPVYWVVNLVESRVEVYTQPRGGTAPGYRGRRDYGNGDSVPLTVTGRDLGLIAVRDLLP